MPELHELDGPVLLLAGPGTGKTYRLARRIKHLVETRGVDPSEVTVITFTTTAAMNMRRRISDSKKPKEYVPPEKQPSRMCTMNSLGHSIIADNAALFGLPDRPAVVPSDVEPVLMADAAQLVGKPRPFSDEVHKCRRHGDCKKKTPEVCEACEWYKSILTACGAMDFQAQLFLACELLSKHDELAASYRAQAKHLLVDEYQDINASQFELIRLLSQNQTEGLFVVGDDDQSVYSWRGGSPAFIRDFRGHFGAKAQVRPLNCSYRCHRKILEGALGVVGTHDKGRLPKGAFTYDCPDGPAVVVHNAASDKQEAEIVAAIAKRAVPSSDVLVLVPTRRYVPAVAKALSRAGVSFAGAGRGPGSGFPLLERLRAWLGDRNDSIALRECIEAMMESGALGVPSKRARLPTKKKAREDAFSKVSGLWEAVIKEGLPLWDSLDRTRKGDKLLEAVHASLSELAAVPDGDLPKFVEMTARVLRPWAKTTTLLKEVAGWIRRAGLASGDSEPPMVRVMTFQAAKGLEADVVCVVGLEEGVMPRAGANTAEQARLLFVSMTRARKELHLFHVRKRSAGVSFHGAYGRGGTGKLVRSPFLDAIPADCKEESFHKAST